MLIELDILKAYYWYDYQSHKNKIQNKFDITLLYKKSRPNIENFNLWKLDDEYILNSLPFCHNIGLEPIYSIEECLQLPCAKGVWYLSFFTDLEIIENLGLPIIFKKENVYSKYHTIDKISLMRSYVSRFFEDVNSNYYYNKQDYVLLYTNLNLGRLLLLRSYFDNTDNIETRRIIPHPINEQARQEYVTTAQPCWSLDLEKETQNIIHIE